MEQIRKHPKDVYRVGEIYNFNVKRPYANYCELEDEQNEITTYLQGTAKLKLFKGQLVKCRVTAVKEKHPKIELVDLSEFEQGTDNLTEEKLSELLSGRELSWNTKDFIKLLLTDEKEQSFESQYHRWIQTLLNKKIDLRVVRRECSDLLELSELLNLCGSKEREFYQERLTLLIEQIGYYIKAAELMDNENGEGSTETPIRFIDSLFNKLRISGFVYHPTKNFNILSSLFLRRPDLMNSKIAELLEIIKGKDIEIWRKEPFKSALVKLLELYVRECDGKIDKRKDNQDLITNNLTALAIQLLLMDNKETHIADYRLNTARLCSLASYIQTISPEHLVDVAFYCLFHSEGKRINYGFDSLGLIPHYIASMYPCGRIDTVNSFSQNNARLSISSEGIHLLPMKSENTTYPVFPGDLGLWKGLQVYLNSKPLTNLSSVRPNDITPYQEVWNEIEGEFFTAKKPIVNTAPLKRKKQHRINDYVRISFISQDLNEKDKYYCQIEDAIGGEGFIYVSDIVPYQISTSLRHFMAPDGSRHIFNAQIIEKEDDLFQFSMLDSIKEGVTDGYYSYDEDIICSLGAPANAYGAAPAITKEGVSVTLRNAGNFAGIGRNSIVSCHLVGKANGTFHIECDINELISYDFDLNSAFKNLMKDMAVGRVEETMTMQDDELILDNDRVLDESYVREVIFLIDRMAFLDKDYVKSYNYLGFARVLCLIIGWESQAAYYKGRMDIIVMLHDFARNERVDKDKLSSLENVNSELFSNNVILRERFMQLQTVSYLGNACHNDDLYRLASENPWLKKLALLCLSYNITLEEGMEKTAVDIYNRIKRQLNLKGFETGLKQYGSGEETETEEYKSSIVFCADEGVKGPNQERQMCEILKVINSFLNTVGGTLYIGVNNFGLGVGVEDDLRSSLYYGDKDKYLRTITDAVSLKWGNGVATACIDSIGFDNDNKDKDVVVVKIRPLAQGVDYDGYWYVRIGSTKRRLTREEFEQYQKKNRKLDNFTEKEIAEETVPIIPGEVTSEAVAIPLVTSREDEIRTSRIRKNILADYMDYENYVEPIGYFKFLGNNKFRKLSGYDYDDQSLLTLTVLEQEKKGYLVLGYDNGHVVKTPVEELLDYQDRDYSRNSEAKLIFASIASGNDAIITISKENKMRPRVMMRADRLSSFDEERLTDSGEMKFNEDLVSDIIAYDVIPEEYLEEFSGILDRKDSFVGYPANNVTREMVERLHRWGITEI